MASAADTFCRRGYAVRGEDKSPIVDPIMNGKDYGSMALGPGARVAIDL